MMRVEKDVPASKRNLPRLAVARLVGHETGRPVPLACFTSNGKYCFTAGTDRTVRLWNPSRLDPAHPPQASAAAIASSTNSNASTPISSLPNALPIQTYSEGFTHDEITAFAVGQESEKDSDSNSSNPTVSLSANNKALVVHDIVTGQCVRRISNTADGRINAVAISDNAETYLSGSYDAVVRIFDGRAKNNHRPILTLSHATDSVTAIGIQQENGVSALIRTASVDGVVRSYDLRMGLLYCDDVGCAVTGMTLTHDEQCLAVNCLDGVVRLLDLSSSNDTSTSTDSTPPATLNTFEGRHAAGQYGLDCSVTADDATIVTGSEDGNAVLYDLVRGTHVQSLLGHTRPTCCIAAHPKRSDVLVTASFDGHAVVWANDDIMQWQE